MIIPRLISAFGAATFTVSFFLPIDFYNSPYRRFLWSVDAAFPLGNWGLTLAFFAVAAIMAYPYIWGLMAALTVIFPKPVKFPVLLQLGCHIIAGVLICVLGVVLLISGDDSLPPAALWLAVIFPPVFISVLFLVRCLVSPERKGSALMAAGSIPFVLLQLLIASAVKADGGVCWGYYLGTVGVVICLFGCMLLLFKPDYEVASDESS